jgi:versiconal hemiacetal acetate reductase
MIPICRHFQVGIIPWSPIARGALARPVNSEPTKRVESDPNYKGRGLDKPDEATTGIINAVEKIANDRGISMAQVSVAWCLAYVHLSRLFLKGRAKRLS